MLIPKLRTHIVLDMAFAAGAGATLFDKSRYRSHGAIVGADWADGLHGRCLNFVAASLDYVEIPLTHTQLNFTSQKFSIIARIYLDDLTSTRRVFNRGLRDTDGYEFYIHSAGHIVIITNQLGTDQFSETAAGVIATGAWYTVGMSRDGASIIPFSNGVDVSFAAGVHIDPDSCARSAKIGIRNNLINDPFDGRIEFFRIFGGIALSASEHLAWHRALA